jgi:hypothetical protein
MVDVSGVFLVTWELPTGRCFSLWLSSLDSWKLEAVSQINHEWRAPARRSILHSCSKFGIGSRPCGLLTIPMGLRRAQGAPGCPDRSVAYPGNLLPVTVFEINCQYWAATPAEVNFLPSLGLGKYRINRVSVVVAATVSNAMCRISTWSCFCPCLEVDRARLCYSCDQSYGEYCICVHWLSVFASRGSGGRLGWTARRRARLRARRRARRRTPGSEVGR